MVKDALRGYVQLASGLTEVTRQRAQQTAKQLLQQTGADTLTSGVTTRVNELADDIIATSKSNRALLLALITNEIEGLVARLGFVRADEVAALRRRLDKLEAQVAGASAAGSTAKKGTAKKATAKKTSAGAGSAADGTAGEATEQSAAENEDTAQSTGDDAAKD